MNDQIDSSIPVLTEVIPAASAPASAANEKSMPIPARQQTRVVPNEDRLEPTLGTTSTPANMPLSNVTQEGLPFPPAIATSATSGKPINSAAPEALPAKENPADAMPKISVEEWQQLEQTVRENVLRQVLSRIDFVLEHRVRDSLAEVLQGAVDNLANEIRAGLHQSLQEVITRAVTQELAKTKQTHK